MGVSLCDMVRNVVTHANSDEEDKPLTSVLAWLDTGTAASWISANVVDTSAFRTALKTPGLTVTELLKQCTLAANAYKGDEGGPSPADVVAVVQLLSSRWEGADLDPDDDDESASSSYKYAATVQALRKAKDQLPMLIAVQQALSLFP